MKIHTVILAAGEGSRMLSSKAKSLQPVGGHSMLKRIYETVQDITDEATFVVGYEKESIIKEANSFNDKINIITDVRFCEYECDEVDWIQSNNGIVLHSQLILMVETCMELHHRVGQIMLFFNIF